MPWLTENCRRKICIIYAELFLGCIFDIGTQGFYWRVFETVCSIHNIENGY